MTSVRETNYSYVVFYEHKSLNLLHSGQRPGAAVASPASSPSHLNILITSLPAGLCCL